MTVEVFIRSKFELKYCYAVSTPKNTMKKNDDLNDL